jgi:hypothetical protein
MGYKKTQILEMIAEALQNKQPIDETTTAALAGTGKMGDYSAESAKTGGFFIGPLGHVPRKELFKRLAYKDGQIVAKVNGQPVTENLILEWFGGDAVRKDKDASPINRKPFWKDGQFVEINPKCLTFPYCSQGDSADKPIKLIGESKEEMSPCAWDIVCALAEQARKEPEYIAKLIRQHYLQLEREIL